MACSRLPEQLTPAELLADWGVTLARGEAVQAFAFARVRAEHRYLVVTNRRFLSLEHIGARTYRKLFDWRSTSCAMSPAAPLLDAV
jgi:hypothetical protein